MAAMKKRILVVDDSQFLTSILSSTLAGAGFDVSTADDVREAVGSLRAEGIPDLILMDLNLPDLKGDQACAAIRRAPACSMVPIVLISGVSEAALQEATQRAGANGWIKKPFSPSSILRWIRDNAGLLEIMEAHRSAPPGQVPASVPPTPQPTAPASAGSVAPPEPAGPGVGLGQDLASSPPARPGSEAPEGPAAAAPAAQPAATPAAQPAATPVAAAPPAAPPAAAETAPAAAPEAFVSEFRPPPSERPPNPDSGEPEPEDPLNSAIDGLEDDPFASFAPPPPEGGAPAEPAAASPAAASVPPMSQPAGPGAASSIPPMSQPAGPSASAPPAPAEDAGLSDLDVLPDIDDPDLVPVSPLATAAAPPPSAEPVGVPGDHEGIAIDGGILVVEDSGFLRSVLRDTLDAAGYHCALVGTMAEGTALLKKIQPGLIILDVNLPDMQGDEACAVLKNIPACASIPMVLMTSGSEEALQTKAEAAGADGYLRKPFTPETLLKWFEDQTWVSTAPEPEAPEVDGRVVDPDRVRAVLTAQLSSQDPATRAQAAYSCGEHALTETAPKLRGMLRDGDAGVVADVLWALGQMRDISALPEIQKLLNEAEGPGVDTNVRMRAVEALGKMGDPGAVRTIALCLAEGRPRDERIVAIQALADLGDTSVQGDLQRVMFEDESEITALAREALAKIQERSTPPA